MFKKKSSKMFMDVKNPFLYNTIFIDRNLARSSIVGDLLGHKGMNVSLSSLPVDYKSLHTLDRGKEVRSLKSYDLQLQAIKKNKAFANATRILQPPDISLVNL